MIKLIGQSLSRGAQIDAESIALNLMERQSTATLSLGPEEPEVAVGEWMLDDVEPGAGIVWRVKTVDDTFNTRTRAVALEHVINTLRDVSMFGEHKTSTIAGDEKAKTVTARQAAEYVLAFQNIWTLGDFEYDMSAPFMFNGDDLFSAMEKISSALDDPWWEYDLTSLPFRLHIRHRSSAKTCEMRMGRNIATLRKTVDRSQMYTRIYPIGKKNLHIEGDFLSKNEGIWGRKDKVETDQSQETEEALRIWAQDRLNRHCEPLVTITIGGLELSRATGESLDHLTLGTMCQVPLPEFHTTITERITKLSWKDKVKEPESVTVTLCNIRQDLASIISQQAAGGGGGARAAAKEAEEDHAWFVDTDSHVAMVAEAIIGRSEDGVDWSRVAEIIVDGEGIHDYVVAAQGSLVVAFGRMDMTDESMTTIYQKTGVDGLAEGETLFSKIAQTAESISAEVRRATAAEEELSSRITMTAESITAEVQRATTAEGTLSSRITQTAESITAEVTRATEAEGTLSSRITQTAESITAEVTRATEAEGTLSSRITQTAESITAEVTRATEAEGTLSSRITQTAESLTTKVSAGDIASTINQTAQSVLISASKINLEGYVTATELDAEKARFDNLTSGVTTATMLTAGTLQANTALNVQGTTFNPVTLRVGSIISATVLSSSRAAIELNHYHTITATESGGTITIKIGQASLTEGSANFSIAATQTYIDGVAAARTSGYNQARTEWRPDNIRISGKNVYVLNAAGDDIGGPYSAASIYNAGWAAAYGKVSWPGAGTSTTFTITAPPSTVDGNADSRTYTLTKGTPSASGGYVSVSRSGTVIARIDISNWWTDAYAAGAASVSLGNLTLNSSSGATFQARQYASDNSTLLRSTNGEIYLDESSGSYTRSCWACVRPTGGSRIAYIALSGYWDAAYSSGAASVSQREATYIAAGSDLTLGSTGKILSGTGTVHYDNQTHTSGVTLEVNATAAYNAGWAGAQAKVEWPGTNTTEEFQVYAPSSTVGNTTSKTFRLAPSGIWSGGKRIIKVTMGGTTVAQITINAPTS